MMIDSLIAGDTLDFTDSVAQYPASAGWTLVYRLVPRFTAPVQAPIVLTASASGDDHRVQATSVATAAWTAGIYGWARWVEKVGERHSLGTGNLTVLADPAQVAQGADNRNQAQKALDNIDAVLANRATHDQKSYSIAGRSLEHMSVDELLSLRAYYAARVRKESGQSGRIYLRA